MGAASSGNSRPVEPLPSRALGLVAAGYSAEAVGLMALLTINNASSVPQLALAATILLIAAGLLLPTAGMLVIGIRFEKTRASARNGFLLQAFGLVALLLGVILAEGLNSLSGFIAGTSILVVSAASGLLGSIMLRRNYVGIGLSGPTATNYLVLAMALLFSGVGLIMASNIAFFYLISGAANGVNTDIGAMISAYGCVVAAYSFFEFR